MAATFPRSRDPGKGQRWKVDVNFGIPLPHKIHIVRANELGMELINYFRKMVYERDQAIRKVDAEFHVDPERARQVIAPVSWPFTIVYLPKVWSPKTPLRSMSLACEATPNQALP